jgi:multisubunit Na+/H+ antiporter MnhB subunit
MAELGAVVVLYLLWDLVPPRVRREGMYYFWAVVVVLGVIGVLHSLWAYGFLPAPSLNWDH